MSRFTTDFWHMKHVRLFFKCTAFLCLSMFLLRGNTLLHRSQENSPLLPSWISLMWTRRFFWLPKYLLHTPHMSLPSFGSGEGVFSLLDVREGNKSLGSLSGEPMMEEGVADLFGLDSTLGTRL